jgi:hypothetical protein
MRKNGYKGATKKGDAYLLQCLGLKEMMQMKTVFGSDTNIKTRWMIFRRILFRRLWQQIFASSSDDKGILECLGKSQTKANRAKKNYSITYDRIK